MQRPVTRPETHRQPHGHDQGESETRAHINTREQMRHSLRSVPQGFSLSFLNICESKLNRCGKSLADNYKIKRKTTKELKNRSDQLSVNVSVQVSVLVLHSCCDISCKINYYTVYTCYYKRIS